ncbi:MAG: aspartyl protease family protein [Saprospiraceae bacterium]|nr:aspartyl protease family protein [Saprospiraceae bacterium]
MNRFRLLFCSLFVVLAYSVMELNSQPSRYPLQNYKVTSGEPIRTPFKHIRGLIFVEVEVNGEEAYFILDSGAPVVVLNTQYFSHGTDDGSAKGVSGSLQRQQIHIDSFRWGNIELSDTDLMGLDLSHLEEELNHPFKGLIGYALLRDFELLIDYEAEELLLFKEGQTAYHKEIQPKSELPFSYQLHIPVLEAEIGGVKYQLGLDTGAEQNLISQPAFEKLPHDAFEVQEKTELRGADKNVTEVQRIIIHKSEFSDHSFGDMPFVSADISHLTAGYGLKISGLVGYPFLSQQLCSIDFVDRKIYFWPKRASNDN